MTDHPVSWVRLTLKWSEVRPGDGFRGFDGNIWELDEVVEREGRLWVTASRDAGADQRHSYEDEVSPNEEALIVWVRRPAPGLPG